MITVTVDDADVVRALNALSQRVGNLKPAMQEIGQTLSDNIRMGFKASRSPWGGKWQPLKRARRRNRKAGDSGHPLLDTGRLRSSITHNATGDSVVVGTNIPYAAIHQFGGRAGRKRAAVIPARPYMPIRNGRADLPADWRDEVMGILQRRIAEAAR